MVVLHDAQRVRHRSRGAHRDVRPRAQLLQQIPQGPRPPSPAPRALSSLLLPLTVHGRRGNTASVRSAARALSSTSRGDRTRRVVVGASGAAHGLRRRTARAHHSTLPPPPGSFCPALLFLQILDMPNRRWHHNLAQNGVQGSGESLVCMSLRYARNVRFRLPQKIRKQGFIGSHRAIPINISWPGA